MQAVPRIGIPVTIASQLLLGVVLVASGCCSYALYGSAVRREDFGTCTRAFTRNDELCVEYEVKRGDTVRKRHLRHTPGQSVATRRGSAPRDASASPAALFFTNSRAEAKALEWDNAIYWWINSEYGKSGLLEILWDAPGQPHELSIDVRESYIPVGEYPRLVLLTPFALAIDIVTSPLQAGILILVWSVDWTAPYN